jgi:hypothetical protein
MNEASLRSATAPLLPLVARLPGCKAASQALGTPLLPVIEVAAKRGAAASSRWLGSGWGK